jgi:hypothetical protein
MEVAMSTGILGLTAILLSVGLSQMITISGKASAGFQAQSDTRNALVWLVRDLQNAQNTDLVDGAPAVGSATLSWTDRAGASPAPHAVSYSLLNRELLRIHNGTSMAVGRKVEAVSFSRSGSMLTVSLTAASQGRFNALDQKTLRVRMRTSG